MRTRATTASNRIKTIVATRGLTTLTSFDYELLGTRPGAQLTQVALQPDSTGAALPSDLRQE